MEKVIVIGCPGSGKSTFSKVLHKVIELPLYHLDMLYWNADRTTVPRPIFLERLSKIIEQDLWIIDGNYGSSIEMRLKACDTVFFLDYPLEICIEGVNLRKGKKRTDMPWVEESDEVDKELIEFIKNYDSNSRPKVIELLNKYNDKNIFIFNSRNEADEFLSQINR